MEKSGEKVGASRRTGKESSETGTGKSEISGTGSERGEAAGKEQTLLSVQTDRKSMQEQTDLLQTELENRSGDREKISRAPVEKEQLSNAKEALLRQKRNWKNTWSGLSRLTGNCKMCRKSTQSRFPCVMRAAYGMDTWKHCF